MDRSFLSLLALTDGFQPASDKVSVVRVEEALFVAHARICGRNKRF